MFNSVNQFLLMSVFALTSSLTLIGINEDAFNFLQINGYIPTNVTFATITAQVYTNALTQLKENEYIGLDLNEMSSDSHCMESYIEDKKSKRSRRSKRLALSGSKWMADPTTQKIVLMLKIETNTNLTNISGTQNDSSIEEMLENASKQWTNVTDISIDWNQSKYLSIILNLSDIITVDYKITPPNSKTNPFIIEINSALISDSVKFVNILVHTLGHALGLGHSIQTNSVMYPFINPNEVKNLSKEDIASIQTLYGINERNPDNNRMDMSPRIDLSVNAINLCENPKIDSVLELADKKWWFFKGDNYYEIGPFGQTMSSPRKIKWDFKEVETPIDAALNWSEDIIFFFKGDKYWKYQNKTFISHRLISDGFKGIPDGNFDDVFKWNVNQKTYFFKQEQFWKYDSKSQKSSSKKISEYWRGIPDSFDAAISSRDRNQTYFFKDNTYYRFDDINKNVIQSTPPYPREINIWFLKCRNIPSANSVPNWSPRPTPPPISQMGSTISDQTPETTPQNGEEEEEEEEGEREGWLIFLTIILGLFIIVIMGTASYTTYLLFFGPQINPEFHPTHHQSSGNTTHIKSPLNQNTNSEPSTAPQTTTSTN